MYYRIVILENTQAQNFMSNCMWVFSAMTIRLGIMFANIDALFLATFSEPILVFIRIMNWKNDSNLSIWTGPFRKNL